MKIIDDKGKLFGWIKPINAYILFFFIFTIISMIPLTVSVIKTQIKTHLADDKANIIKINELEMQLADKNTEIANYKKVFKEHPRMEKYFKK